MANRTSPLASGFVACGQRHQTIPARVLVRGGSTENRITTNFRECSLPRAAGDSEVDDVLLHGSRRRAVSDNGDLRCVLSDFQKPAGTWVQAIEQGTSLGYHVRSGRGLGARRGVGWVEVTVDGGTRDTEGLGVGHREFGVVEHRAGRSELAGGELGGAATDPAPGPSGGEAFVGAFGDEVADELGQRGRRRGTGAGPAGVVVSMPWCRTTKSISRRCNSAAMSRRCRTPCR